MLKKSPYHVKKKSLVRLFFNMSQSIFIQLFQHSLLFSYLKDRL